MHTIYYLENPLNGVIYYVGMTSMPLKQRLNIHCYQSSIPTTKKLSDAGIRPLIKEIETSPFYFKVEALPTEIYWIHQFCAWGYPLENKTIAFSRKVITRCSNVKANKAKVN